MINDQQDILSFSFNNISMEVTMRLRDICLGLIDDGWFGLLLDDGARVAVIV